MAHFRFSRFPSKSFRCFSKWSTALLAVAALALAGCHQAVTDPNDPKFIVAEKKPDWQITRAQLNEQIAGVLKTNQTTAEQVGPDKMSQLETSLLRNMVIEKLILAKAATLTVPDMDKQIADTLEQFKQRVPPGEDFDQQLKDAGLTLDVFKQRLHDKILIRKVLETEALKNVEPTDQEINDFYLKNQAKLVLPAKVRASRILMLVTDKTTPAGKALKKVEIDKARDRVLKGEDFSKVAAEVSEDQYSKSRGGDIGYFRAGESESPQFDQIAFNTKLGQVSEVFETPLGYQFLKVTDIHPKGQASLAEARPAIAKLLLSQKQQASVKAYTENLIANSGATIHLLRVDPAQPPEANPTQPPADPATK